jgi:hypothetical protein
MKGAKFCGAIAGIILLYALSIGPAVAVFEWRRYRTQWPTEEEFVRAMLRSRAYLHRVRVAYTPVLWVTDRVGMRSVRVGYCKLWMDAAAHLQGRTESDISPFTMSWLSNSPPPMNLIGRPRVLNWRTRPEDIWSTRRDDIGYPRVSNWPTRREDATTALPQN